MSTRGGTRRRWAVLAAVWGMALPLEAALVRGPYLQQGTPTNIIVRWRTSPATNSAIWWVQAGGGDTQLLAQAGSRVDHVMALTNLTPETTYQYAVGSIGGDPMAGGDGSLSFRTSPLAGEARETRIWVLGDSGTANSNARGVRDAFQTWNGTNRLDLWMMLGDNAYGIGSDAEYQGAVFNMYTQQLPRVVLWPTLGNHDGITAESATESGPYYDIFSLPRAGEAGGMASGTEAYYSFDYANIHFICLESYETDRGTNGLMLTWLREDLAATTQAWTIAFWHHPPYTKGSHDSDSTEMQLVEMRQFALPILEAGRVDLVLTGHSHSYERSMLLHGHYGYSWTLEPAHVVDSGDGRESGDGVYDVTTRTGAVYVVAGSSGQISGGSLDHPVMFANLNALGSLVLDVAGNRLDAYFIRYSLFPAPPVADWFSIVKGVESYTLVTKVQGPGEVTPGGVYPTYATVTVTGAPSLYHAFEGWTGDAAGTTNPLSLVMDGNKQVTGTFAPILATNGVPWWWLAGYGLETNDVAALADQDEDVHAAWAEYVAGTDPTDAWSRLHLSQLDLGEAFTNVVLAWPSVSNRIYGIERTDALAGGFTPIAGASNLVSTPPSNQWEAGILSGDTSVYYRIRAGFAE